MSEQALLERDVAATGDEESAKRRQIVKGAYGVFLAQGFDAASMNDIARAAGVSKGTLYVYFDSKEDLFEAVVEQECEAQAIGIFDLDANDHDLEAVLRRLGVAYVSFLCEPKRASAFRTVTAIAERMPSFGRRFYERGPARGIARLSAYLAAQVEAGILVIEDCEVTAAQFLESCHAALFRPVLFNAGPEPSQERVEHGVRIAVKAFLAAYRVPAKSSAS
jgi:AcrR family transcriptional regulator